MRRIISFFTLAVLYATVTFGQAAVEVPFTVEDSNGNLQELIFGLDLTATPGIDPALGESEQPPLPPGGVFDARFASNSQSNLGEGTLKDIRNAPLFPFSGTYIHQIKYQPGDPVSGADITISWNLPPEIIAGSEIHDIITGTLIQAAFVGVGSVTVPNPGSFPQLEIVIVYDNIGPVGPAPEFVITPTSLDFGPVGVGVPSMLQATVSNPGTDPLDITGITSSDPQFTYTPATATIPAGGNQIFDITFTPTTLGPQSADIEFTHNAPTSPDILPVIGVGADAGPTFGVSPASLDFGVVLVGLTPVQTLTVTNNGLTNPMNITSVTAPTGYTVTPLTAAIAPGGTQDFDVTFIPLTDITYAGDVTFVHDGSTSPDAVPVTGEGYVPPAINGLVFTQDTSFVLEDSFYPETMRLIVPPGPDVQAL